MILDTIENECGGQSIQGLKILSSESWELLLSGARTYGKWQRRSVSQDLIKKLYDYTKLGPTSFNCCPMRITFVTTEESKKRLKPGLMPTNIDRTLDAPVVAIIGTDTRFFEHLDDNLYHKPVSHFFINDEGFSSQTAFQNSTLQAGYFILIARGLGLDCGPVAGIYPDIIDQEFFPDGRVRTNFICALGYGDDADLPDRLPRLDFDTACEII